MPPRPIAPTIQGSTPNLQGGTIRLQGSSPVLQGSRNTIQVGNAPYGGAILTNLKKSVNSNNSAINTGNSAWSKLLADTNALLQSLNRKVYAPALDYNAVNAQARKQAAGAVNPLYTKYLNDFIKEQKFQKQTEQQKTQMDIKNIEDALSSTLSQNELTGQRTAEDTATKIGQIGTQADQFQEDEGKQFEAGRLALGTQIAQSGLGKSGLGGQQQVESVQNQNTAESRQMEQFKQASERANLLKSRTMQDIMISGEEAKKTAQKGKERTQFNLDTYIKQQAFDLANKKNTLEAQRQTASASETRNRTSALVRAFISAIKDPAQREAALNAYGGLL